MRVKLYDAKGAPVDDRILLKPHQDGEMHPAVAAANLLKIWIAADAAQCCREMAGIVVTGEIKSERRIVVDGRNYELVIREGRERCAALRSDKFKEPYWILNPGAPGVFRYLVKTDRSRLSRSVERLDALCRNPKNAAVYGMKIK